MTASLLICLFGSKTDLRSQRENVSEAGLLRYCSDTTDVLIRFGRNYGSFLWLKLTFNRHQSIEKERKKKQVNHLESESSWHISEDMRIISYRAAAPLPFNPDAQPVQNRVINPRSLMSPGSIHSDILTTNERTNERASSTEHSLLENLKIAHLVKKFSPSLTTPRRIHPQLSMLFPEEPFE
jgi:hypothetical protein